MPLVLQDGEEQPVPPPTLVALLVAQPHFLRSGARRLRTPTTEEERDGRVLDIDDKQNGVVIIDEDDNDKGHGHDNDDGMVHDVVAAELPFTGLPLWIVLALAIPLLGSGLALRKRN